MRKISRTGEKKRALLGRSMGLFWLCLFLLPLLAGCGQEKEAEASALKESAAPVMDSEIAAPLMKERSLTGASVQEEMDSAPITEAEFRLGQAIGEQKEKDCIRSVYFNGNKNWIAPVFLLKSEAAVAANREIRAKLQQITKDSTEAGKTRITYQSWMQGNILSVLIQMESGAEDETHFAAYNFDTATGERLTVDQLLQIAGMDWPAAKQIFAGERKAYWRAIAVQNGRPEESYSFYWKNEIKTLQTLYEKNQLAAILDEDQLFNLLGWLRDEYGKSYWRLYCVTANRTTLLQRNAYGGDFPAVVLADPSAEELANVKIVKKILQSAGDQKKTYLLLPLWDGLSFEWSKQDMASVRAGREADKKLWVSEELPGEDTIYIELSGEGERNTRYYGIFRQYEEKITFDPKDFQALEQEERGILYLTPAR